MHYFTKKEQLVIMFLILVIIIISLFNFLKKDNLNLNSTNIDNDINPENLLKEIENNTEEVEKENDIIMVHISGEVFKSGLVKLKLGSRVIDAVELAGGLKKDADIDRINLAKKLADEEKIYIPKIGEEDTPADMSFETGDVNSQKVNINTATKEQLMTLPGIGEVLAGRIIDYRENTPFSNIEDIKNVSGIGDKKFEGIENLIIIR